MTLFCKDCRWFDRNIHYLFLAFKITQLPLCKSPRAYEPPKLDLVTGESIIPNYEDCATQRRTYGECKPEARYWEVRP